MLSDDDVYEKSVLVIATAFHCSPQIYDLDAKPPKRDDHKADEMNEENKNEISRCLRHTKNRLPGKVYFSLLKFEMYKINTSTI